MSPPYRGLVASITSFITEVGSSTQRHLIIPEFRTFCCGWLTNPSNAVAVGRIGPGLLDFSMLDHRSVKGWDDPHHGHLENSLVSGAAVQPQL